MKKYFLMTVVTLTALAVQAQSKKQGLPTIIDRELFFGDPEISGAKISPNGNFISFIKPFKGTRNIWIKKASEPFESAKPITADTKRPISSYFWSNDSKYILYVQDKGGDENYMVYAVNPLDKSDSETGVPNSRNLTDKPKVRAMIYSVPLSNPDLMYIGLNDRDPAWHDLYQLKISTGELKLLRQNDERMVAWIFDLKDKLRLAMRSNEDGSTDLLRVDPKAFVPIYHCDVLENFAPIYFHTDGAQVYLETNKGTNTDISKLILLNILNKKETFVESDPEKKVDFGSAEFSEMTHKMLYTSYTEDKPRLYWKDKELESEYNSLKKQFKGKEVSLYSPTRDERKYLIATYSDSDPGTVYLYDRNTKKTTFQYKPRPNMPLEDLAPMKPISYKSSDGMVIPAYLTLPKGIASKNLPLVVFPHGGPWARDYWGYHSYAQFLANRGYAVLQPNFRSSTGFGKKFIDAGNKQWGDKMQDDITWGVRHLVEKGIVDPKRVGIMGGSYGGYATLAGLTFTPDVYACGVSLVGPSSLLTLLNSIPPYWEAGRKIFHERMGDPTNPEGEAQLKRQSPLFSVDKIKAPLLVVQGANDPRVKKAESDQIVMAMRNKNLPVEYICAPDEGHGFARPVNNMAFCAAAEKFLAAHLGGRFQEEMPPAVAERLKEITVNPANLSEAEKLDESSLVIAVPDAELIPGTYLYKVKLEAMGQNMDLIENIEIQDKGDHFFITDQMETPMGEMKEEGSFEKKSIAPRKRFMDQGPVNILMDYTATQVNLKMNISGQKKESEIKLNQACFADGPANFMQIACLPLSESYKTKVSNVDLHKMSSADYIISVDGSESIKGQDCWVISMKSAAGDPGDMVIWIGKTDRRVYQYTKIIPEMGAAKMTGTLEVK